MADHTTADHQAHAHGDDHGGHVKIYIRVFISLAILTAIEYFYAHIFKDTMTALILGLMTWAIIKAALVGLYFMHVKYEGRWIYLMLVPAGFLATVLVVALLPDMALQASDEELAGIESDELDAPPPITTTPSGNRGEVVEPGH